MKINLRENKNGITLIALIITIIVLLILAGVSITTLTGENGILNRATNAREVNDKASAKEEIQLEVMASYGVDGNVENGLLKENLSKINGIEGVPDSITDASYPLKVTLDGKVFEIGKSGTVQNIKPLVYQSVSEVFDANGKDENAEGYDPNKLHIGDFVNYDAGTWTADEISAIQTGTKGSEVTANGTASLPNQAYQFGGFTAGSSRNGNANLTYSSYNYAKDEEGDAITGWRVFDVEENNVTLISSGCPEDYFHPGKTDSYYISEYIITGSTTGSITTGDYTKRNWNDYIKNNSKATEVKVLTLSALESWYNKYMNQTGIINKEKFKTIQGTKYESMVDNYSKYWIGNRYSSSFLVEVISPSYHTFESVTSGNLGIRLLVSLSDIQLAKTTETKTVSSPNYSAQTYSVWNYK